MKQQKAKKTKKDTNKLDTIKKWFNNPLPMLIILTVIIVVLLIFILTHNQKSKIYVGSINSDDVQVVNVHYFTSDDMNYFYASNAAYLGDNKNVYSYQIGYYAVSDNGEYHEFATRANKLDNASPIKDLVLENSGWTISELANNDYFFDADVLKNIENLHFVILASTDKEKPNEPDIKVDYKVSLSKLTK